MANEYAPWKELGITELEYWKQRYIESQEMVDKLEGRILDLECWIRANYENKAEVT